MAGRSWAPEEDQYIESNYYNKTISDMGSFLNRSRASIMHRISFLKLERKRIPVDMEINQQINRLTLKEKFKKNGYRFGKFECSCPLKKVVEVLIWNVVNEKIRSCGCIKTEKDSARFTAMNFKHGMSDTDEHNTWMSIKSRCYNTNDNNYIYYGGRGVRVSNEWLENFLTFYNDMGPKPEPKKDYHIGRIDHDDMYRKSNCRWITQKTEEIDRENNLNILAFGETKNLIKWSKDNRCNASINTIKYRLWKLGWNTERAINTIEYKG